MVCCNSLATETLHICVVTGWLQTLWTIVHRFLHQSMRFSGWEYQVVFHFSPPGLFIWDLIHLHWQVDSVRFSGNTSMGKYYEKQMRALEILPVLRNEPPLSVCSGSHEEWVPQDNFLICEKKGKGIRSLPVKEEKKFRLFSEKAVLRAGKHTFWNLWIHLLLNSYHPPPHNSTAGSVQWDVQTHYQMVETFLKVMGISTKNSIYT